MKTLHNYPALLPSLGKWNWFSWSFKVARGSLDTCAMDISCERIGSETLVVAVLCHRCRGVDGSQ